MSTKKIRIKYLAAVTSNNYRRTKYNYKSKYLKLENSKKLNVSENFGEVSRNTIVCFIDLKGGRNMQCYIDKLAKFRLFTSCY